MRKSKVFIFVLCIVLLASCSTNNKKPEYSNRTENIEPVKQGSPEHVNLDLGVGYLKRGRDGDLDIAMGKFKKAINYNPEYALAHSMIANVYDQKGLFNDAEKHYKLSIQFNNNNPDILNNYANFLCQRGFYDKSINYYLKIVNNPQYKLASYAYENAGICSYKAKNVEQAENYFRKSLSIDTKQSNSLYYLMMITKENKQYMKARAFLQRLEGLFNSSPELLFAGYEIEQALGNNIEAKKYLTELKKDHPESELLKKIK